MSVHTCTRSFSSCSSRSAKLRMSSNESATTCGLRSSKFLRRNLKKPEENPNSLIALQEMQRAAVACKGMSFPMADRAEGEAKAELQKGYKLEMIGCIEAMLQMERALLEGDNDKARELYKTVKAFEDSGHEKYTEE